MASRYYELHLSFAEYPDASARTLVDGTLVADQAGQLADFSLTVTFSGGESFVMDDDHYAVAGESSLYGQFAYFHIEPLNLSYPISGMDFYSTSALPQTVGTEVSLSDPGFSYVGSTIGQGYAFNYVGTAKAVVCYRPGTRILTPSGEVPIERLREGDAVMTRFGGVRPVHWIGRQTLRGGDPAHAPIRFAPGSLGQGLPRRTLLVSPGHSMLLGETLVLAVHLVNGTTITREAPREAWTYLQLEFGSHDCVLAEGTWSESFADAATLRDQFDNVDEFRARYPLYRAPAEVRLCAPRPTAGTALEAALRAVAERAANAVLPGTLVGEVETIANPGLVTGWARDAAHPGLPVLLEIVLGGAVIGTALACHPRWDLAGEGTAEGRGAFRFEVDRILTPAEMAGIVVRRAVNGAVLGRVGGGAAAEAGTLDGHLDLVAAPCRVEGWARDLAHPERPVLLEVVLDGQVLGLASACRYRADLAEAGLGKAGLGDGRIAFFFEASRRLSREQLERLSVRRRSDGRELRDDRSCREEHGTGLEQPDLEELLLTA